MNMTTLRKLWKPRRDAYSKAHLYEEVRVRIHRALTWLEFSERCDIREDLDAKLIAQWIAFTDANDIRHGDFSDTTNALWMVFMANHPSGKSYSAATIRTYASAIKSVVLESGIMPCQAGGTLTEMTWCSLSVLLRCRKMRDSATPSSSTTE